MIEGNQWILETILANMREVSEKGRVRGTDVLEAP
jgi:hypothetical protein